jgi:hypothetical protein
MAFTLDGLYFKLFQKIKPLVDENALVVLDNIHLIADGTLNDEILLLSRIRELINSEKSLIIFGTTLEPTSYCFRIPLQFSIKPIGSGFGKKVNGQVSEFLSVVSSLINSLSD